MGQVLRFLRRSCGNRNFKDISGAQLQNFFSESVRMTAESKYCITRKYDRGGQIDKSSSIYSLLLWQRESKGILSQAYKCCKPIYSSLIHIRKLTNKVPFIVLSKIFNNFHYYWLLHLAILKKLELKTHKVLSIHVFVFDVKLKYLTSSILYLLKQKYKRA